jgi:hypothetical protein
MRMQDIEITIGPTGEVSFEVKGVKGSRCIDETRFLEEAVGEVTERERTAAYYEADETGASVRVSSDSDDD